MKGHDLFETPHQRNYHRKFVGPRCKILRGLENVGNLECMKMGAKISKCGKAAAAYRDPSGWIIIGSARCKSRLCPTCASIRSKESWARMNQLIKSIDDVRMLTLTMKATNEPLKDQLKTLRESWNKFRRQKQIKAKIKGGLCVMEITHNAKSDRWHPHLHIVFEGDYLDQKKASECWAKSAAGSTIVDIRRIPSRMAAVNYLAKYVSKTSIFPVKNIKRLDEWVTAVKGLREFSTFGTLHNRIKKEVREKRELEHWMYLGQLVECGAQDHPGCMAAYSRILKLPRKTGDSEVDDVLLGRHLAAYEYANEQYRDFLGIKDPDPSRKRKQIEPDLFDDSPPVLTTSMD